MMWPHPKMKDHTDRKTERISPSVDSHKQQMKFRRRVVLWVQVWFPGSMGRFGRIGSDFGLPSASPILPPRLIAHDCGKFAHF